MLYRYIFRGTGVLLVVGMITVLVLAYISVQRENSVGHTGPAQSRDRGSK